MIGGLLYLTASKPNIMQVVYLVARFQANPKVAHEQAMKRTFGYLKGTMDFGLWYKKGGDFILKVYIDLNWVGSIDDRKSTNGIAFFLGDKLVSWVSKKQDSVSLSTVEAEYIAIASCCT